MAITAREVKELRDRTGAGMMDCKKALEETDGAMESAIDLLRSRGAAKAAKREDKSALEGAIGTYVHHSGKVGVMVEVNCETDFVAKTDDFQGLARDLAMHIAAARPISVSVDAIPAEEIERERAVYAAQVETEGKPEKIREKIVEGKLAKWFKEVALLEQGFVKDPDQKISDLITTVSAKTGEKIEVARFARFSIGD
ncbi:MAG: translation elongation factor Ts [Longimicrobiales bacterium]|nr:translation elongation factor Ts [Longimicrobiales bacterium]